MYCFVVELRKWFPFFNEQVGEGLAVVGFEKAGQQSVEGMVVGENYHVLSCIYCHSDDRREEESREHQVGVIKILRFALDDIRFMFPQSSKPIVARPFSAFWVREAVISVHLVVSIHSRCGRVIHYK